MAVSCLKSSRQFSGCQFAICVAGMSTEASGFCVSETYPHAAASDIDIDSFFISSR